MGTGTRADLLDRLAGTIESFTIPHPLRVAVDGPTAAGKRRSGTCRGASVAVSIPLASLTIGTVRASAWFWVTPGLGQLLERQGSEVRRIEA